ncbi:hypothetical protein H0X32_04320 [Patescibacteria group bacterium]|nr:hypothetical protein [Patescibacteria group bacterium]
MKLALINYTKTKALYDAISEQFEKQLRLGGTNKIDKSLRRDSYKALQKAETIVNTIIEEACEGGDSSVLSPIRFPRG